MEVFRRHPARAGQAGAEAAEAAAQVVGQGEGNEEAHDRTLEGSFRDRDR
jgi:hypothetical protein